MYSSYYFNDISKKLYWFPEIVLLMSAVTPSSCYSFPKSLPLCFSARFCRARCPTGSALLVVWATANPLAKIMTFFSPLHYFPSTLYVLNLFYYCLCLTSAFAPFFPHFSFQSFSSRLSRILCRVFGVLLKAPLLLSSLFNSEWKPVEHKKQVWSCEEFTQWIHAARNERGGNERAKVVLHLWGRDDERPLDARKRKSYLKHQWCSKEKKDEVSRKETVKSLESFLLFWNACHMQWKEITIFIKSFYLAGVTDDLLPVSTDAAWIDHLSDIKNTSLWIRNGSIQFKGLSLNNTHISLSLSLRLSVHLLLWSDSCARPQDSDNADQLQNARLAECWEPV